METGALSQTVSGTFSDFESQVQMPCPGAKGTSLLVDTGDKKILFNVGLRDRYLSHNMDFLDIDPESIDAVVISQSNPTASSAINGLLKRREVPRPGAATASRAQHRPPPLPSGQLLTILARTRASLMRSRRGV